tara:strand:+ start:323 stop:574 length:252 start_codon:yes stop_codon:yes gene_type:complete
MSSSATLSPPSTAAYTYVGPGGEERNSAYGITLDKLWAKAYPDAEERAEAMRARWLPVAPRMRNMLIAFLTFTYGETQQALVM